MNRRRIRRYRNQRRNSGMKFLGIIGIMIIAVICGYLTARFVIAPLLGYDTEVLKLDLPSKLTAVLDRSGDSTDDEDTADKDESKKTSQAQQDEKKDNAKDDEDGVSDSSDSDDKGYALQFGLFSTEAKAEELVSKLEDEGIDSKIKEIDGKYKVISPIVSTKDEAVEKLKNTDSKEVSDVFITVIK